MTSADGPKRVLFVIGSLGGGGAERQLIDLLRHLDRSRFAPALYLAYRRGELLAEVPADIPIAAFDDSAPPRPWSATLAAKLRCPSWARALHLNDVLRRQPADLIFAWGLRCAGETAWPAKRQRVARVVYCVVDPESELALEFPRVTPGRRRWAQAAYSSADLVFGNADALRMRLQSVYRLPAERVETLPNLRDFDRLDRLAEEASPSWPADGAKLLSVGRLHPQKGQMVLLEAMAELVHRRGCPVQLVMAGQGPLEADLRRAVTRLRLEGRVQFAGYVANPAPYFRAADVFVLPSLYEGLPNVLLEAVALGTPCVAADCPTGPREILQDGRWGPLVPPGDVNALTSALEAVVRDLPTARQVAVAARESIHTRYNLPTGLRRLESRLEVLLQSLRRPPR